MAFPGATAGYQAGAQANDVTLSYALESQFGVPAAGAYQATRFTGESLRRQKSRDRPQEINATYEAAQSVTTQDAVSGSISAVFSTTTYDDFLAGVLMRDFATASVTTSASLSAAVKLNADAVTYTLNAGQVGNWATLPSVGVISFSGDTGGAGVAVTGQWGVVSNDGTNLVMVPLQGQSAQAANRTLPNGVTIAANSASNGTTFKSFTLREPIAGQITAYTGAFINRAQLSWQQGQFATASFDIMAAGETTGATDPASSVTAAPSGTVHDTIKGFGGLTIAGTLKASLRQVSLTIARDGAGQDFVMGTPLAAGMRPGSVLVSGTIQLLFKSYADYAYFQNETSVPIGFTVKDAAGKGYVFFLPNATLQNGQVDAGSKNSTIVASFDIEANPVPAGGTIGIGRF